MILTLRAFQGLPLRLGRLAHGFLLLPAVFHHVFLRLASRLLVGTALRVCHLVGKSLGVQQDGCDQCKDECQLFHLDSVGEYDDSTAVGETAISRSKIFAAKRANLYASR